MQHPTSKCGLQPILSLHIGKESEAEYVLTVTIISHVYSCYLTCVGMSLTFTGDAPAAGIVFHGSRGDIFWSSSTGYTPGADQYNYDHAQFVKDGYADGGECLNFRRPGGRCKGDGVSDNDSGCCTGCATGKRRHDNGNDFDSDEDQAHADAAPQVKRGKNNSKCAVVRKEERGKK